MNDKDKTGDSFDVKIDGAVSGQVGVGKHVHQSQTTVGASVQLTEAELVELRAALNSLKAHVTSEAPQDKKAAALERVGELEDAVIAKKPDTTTIQYVRKWFVKNLPQLAGAVTAVIVHPIVGKAVAAAGEITADEFRRRLGRDEEETTS